MSSKDLLAWRHTGDTAYESPERVVEEGPLSLVVNGAPFTVTLRTPGDDRALVLGLLFAEGIVQEPRDLLALVPGAGADRPATGDGGGATEAPVTVWDARVRDHAGLAAKLGNRSLASTSSCGMCGKTEWEDPAATVAPSVVSSPRERQVPLTTGLLEACFAEMRAQQRLFGDTGGSHAAAIFAEDGTLRSFGEDAGRHNAVDKAVGRLWEAGDLGRASLLCVSGRVSYEIATKAQRAGVTVLAAVSAPTSLAVSYCADHGITLVGFCRGTKATVYAHPQRFGAPCPEPR
jgi:FdhD protein